MVRRAAVTASSPSRTSPCAILVVLAHHRRRVLRFNVTTHPSAAWTARQIVDAFPDNTAPSYLLRDRDSVYGDSFRRRVLTRYFAYYQRTRTHLALEKDAPDTRPVQHPEVGAIVATPEVGGLHHR
jgi:hypothetical protein